MTCSDYLFLGSRINILTFDAIRSLHQMLVFVASYICNHYLYYILCNLPKQHGIKNKQNKCAF